MPLFLIKDGPIGRQSPIIWSPQGGKGVPNDFENNAISLAI